MCDALELSYARLSPRGGACARSLRILESRRHSAPAVATPLLPIRSIHPSNPDGWPRTSGLAVPNRVLFRLSYIRSPPLDPGAVSAGGPGSTALPFMVIS